MDAVGRKKNSKARDDKQKPSLAKWLKCLILCREGLDGLESLKKEEKTNS